MCCRILSVAMQKGVQIGEWDDNNHVISSVCCGVVKCSAWYWIKIARAFSQQTENVPSKCYQSPSWMGKKLLNLILHLYALLSSLFSFWFMFKWAWSYKCLMRVIPIHTSRPIDFSRTSCISKGFSHEQDLEDWAPSLKFLSFSFLFSVCSGHIACVAVSFHFGMRSHWREKWSLQHFIWCPLLHSGQRDIFSS